jgi:hypothetical protein
MPRQSRALSWFAARSWKTIPTTTAVAVRMRVISMLGKRNTLTPIPTPDVAGEGITGPKALMGAGVTITGCIIPPCPPPPALIMDLEALPEAPAGSDADRIARGLQPIENDRDENSVINQADLGLPDSGDLRQADATTQETDISAPE